jgi:hypothetical protein
VYALDAGDVGVGGAFVVVTVTVFVYVDALVFPVLPQPTNASAAPAIAIPFDRIAPPVGSL